MREKIKEALVTNVIIIVVLSLLAGFSLKESVAVGVFSEIDEPIYRAETEEKNVSLMINVYQGEEYVLEYLKLFEKENIKATFFIGGCWAEKNTNTLKKIHDSGNEIGNHGYNHKLHTKLSSKDAQNEIMRTHSLIKEVTGVNCTLFAPPSGDVSREVVLDAKNCGYVTVMWTADTIDWRDQDTKKIADRIKRNLKPGALILMHPTAATLEALPEIILYLRSQGYTFKTVGEQLK